MYFHVFILQVSFLQNIIDCYFFSVFTSEGVNNFYFLVVFCPYFFDSFWKVSINLHVTVILSGVLTKAFISFLSRYISRKQFQSWDSWKTTFYPRMPFEPLLRSWWLFNSFCTCFDGKYLFFHGKIMVSTYALFWVVSVYQQAIESLL